MGLPVAFQGSENSHGAGGLISTNPNIMVEGKPIITVGDNAKADNFPLPPHPNPKAANGSSTVFANGKPVHRLNDGRSCGAKTVNGATTVLAG